MSKVATLAGTLMFCISGAALDGPDWILGLVGVFIGLGIGCIGCIGTILKGGEWTWES